MVRVRISVIALPHGFVVVMLRATPFDGPLLMGVKVVVVVTVLVGVNVRMHAIAVLRFQFRIRVRVRA